MSLPIQGGVPPRLARARAQIRRYWALAQVHVDRVRSILRRFRAAVKKFVEEKTPLTGKRSARKPAAAAGGSARAKRRLEVEGASALARRARARGPRSSWRIPQSQ